MENVALDSRRECHKMKELQGKRKQGHPMIEALHPFQTHVRKVSLYVSQHQPISGISHAAGYVICPVERKQYSETAVER